MAEETPQEVFKTHFTGEATGIESDRFEIISRLVENIDKQGIDNIRFFESKSFPGVIFPYTTVNVNRLVTETLGIPLTEKVASDKELQEKKTYVVFQGYEVPPNGDPFSAWDMIYDRAITSLSQTKSSQVEIIALGSPIGVGGKITDNWISHLQENGFSAYGKIYAELIGELDGKNPDSDKSKYIFHGMSMGSPIADHTARNLPELHSNIQLLLDNPAGIQGGKFSILKGLQLPLGFAAEGLFKMKTDPNVRERSNKERVFAENLKKILADKGFNLDESEGQMDLKKKVLWINVINLIKGSELDTENVRTYIRRGLYDPLTFSINRYLLNQGLLERGLDPVTKYVPEDKAGSKGAKEFAFNSSHFVDRFRIKRWERAISSILNRSSTQ